MKGDEFMFFMASTICTGVRKCDEIFIRFDVISCTEKGKGRNAGRQRKWCKLGSRKAKMQMGGRVHQWCLFWWRKITNVVSVQSCGWMRREAELCFPVCLFNLKTPLVFLRLPRLSDVNFHRRSLLSGRGCQNGGEIFLFQQRQLLRFWFLIDGDDSSIVCLPAFVFTEFFCEVLDLNLKRIK